MTAGVLTAMPPTRWTRATPFVFLKGLDLVRRPVVDHPWGPGVLHDELLRLLDGCMRVASTSRCTSTPGSDWK